MERVSWSSAAQETEKGRSSGAVRRAAMEVMLTMAAAGRLLLRAALDHALRDRLAEQEDGAQIGGEGAVEGLGLHLEQRALHRRKVGVDQNVDAPETVIGRGDEVGDAELLGQLAAPFVDRRADLGGGVAFGDQRLFVGIRHQDLGALFEEAPRDGAAHAAGRAGDDGRASFQKSRHAPLPKGLAPCLARGRSDANARGGRAAARRVVSPQVSVAGRRRARYPACMTDTDFLARRPANHQPLTPIFYLERAAKTHPEALAIVHGDQRVSYADFYARSRRLASALAARGVRAGDTVATLLLNTPPQLEAHYGVPMLGATLNAINTRLDAAGVAFILDHGEAKALIVDSELAPLAREALETARPSRC
jgi:hypothetical protein